MPSSTIEMQETLVKPLQTMRGHTSRVAGIVHLHDGRRIITCSVDTSLRLWDLESGEQIGDEWRDERDPSVMYTIKLSPDGNTVVSGSTDAKMRLWHAETGKLIGRWIGHTSYVSSVCWSGDGERIVSGSKDGTARVWAIEFGKTVLGPIKTGHQWVHAVMYSPDNTKFATGGQSENAVKIWDANTGELLSTLKHDDFVYTLAWTSDGKTLISGSYPIRIFDTATWQQTSVLVRGGFAFLSPNGRFLASAALDKTARLWDLETNLPVGPILQHDDHVSCAAFSADGKLLVTGCSDDNVYVWYVYAILKEVGREDLLSIPDVRLTEKSWRPIDAVDTQGSDQLEGTRLPLRGYLIDSDTEESVHPSPTRHHPNTDETPHSRQNSISHHGRSLAGVAAVQDKGALYVARQARPKPAHVASTSTPHHATAVPGAADVDSRPIIIDKPTRWSRFWLFVCCISARYANSS